MRCVIWSVLSLQIPPPRTSLGRMTFATTTPPRTAGCKRRGDFVPTRDANPPGMAQPPAANRECNRVARPTAPADRSAGGPGEPRGSLLIIN